MPEETFNILFQYGALGAIAGVFLWMMIKSVNSYLPALLQEFQTLNRMLKLILKAIFASLPRSAKQKLSQEYLEEFSEEMEKEERR